jgi:hypothetical protein
VTLCIPERSSFWLVDWHGATVRGGTMPPPRDPDDLDQAVVREPDE